MSLFLVMSKMLTLQCIYFRFAFVHHGIYTFEGTTNCKLVVMEHTFIDSHHYENMPMQYTEIFKLVKK